MRLFICDQPGANDAGRFISLGLEKRGQHKPCKSVGERVQYSKQHAGTWPCNKFFRVSLLGSSAFTGQKVGDARCSLDCTKAVTGLTQVWSRQMSGTCFNLHLQLLLAQRCHICLRCAPQAYVHICKVVRLEEVTQQNLQNAVMTYGLDSLHLQGVWPSVWLKKSLLWAAWMKSLGCWNWNNS